MLQSGVEPLRGSGGRGANAVPRCGTIDLWFAFPDSIRDKGLLEDYRAILTDDERAQEQRFYFAKDRHQYLVTRALVRTTLSRYAAVDPADWRFTSNEYGRPAVAPSEEAPDPGREFNLSHTTGAILCAVGSCRALGVDVEDVRRQIGYREVVNRCLSENEIKELGTHSPLDRPERFFEYWTLKEAYVKAVGQGLSIPLDRISFTLSGERHVAVSFDPRFVDDPRSWRFWLLKPSHDHVAAVCASQSSTEAWTLAVHEVVPLISQRLLECPIVRRSDA